MSKEYIKKSLLSHQKFFNGLPYRTRKAYTWVTKIVKVHEDPESINRWIEEVGKEEAEAISEEAKRLFKATIARVFSIIDNDDKTYPKHYTQAFSCLPGILNNFDDFYLRNINIVNYKDKWQGKVDLVASLYGEPTFVKILGFTKDKTDYLEKYLVELAAYVQAFNSWANGKKPPQKHKPVITQAALLYVDLELNTELMTLDLSDLEAYKKEFSERTKFYKSS